MNADYKYQIRSLPKDEFFRIQNPLKNQVFEEDHSIFPSQFFSHEEKRNIELLKGDFYEKRYQLYLGAFDSKDQMVGWSFGFQVDAHTFYMCNSGVLKEYRRKGIYSLLLQESLNRLKEKGFQVIYSRHCATNNAVIIPKLKAGFIISSLEVDDIFGTLVHLKFLTNAMRRKLMDYRTGQLKPDEELLGLF